MKEIAVYETFGTNETTANAEHEPDTLRSTQLDELTRRGCNGDREAIAAIVVVVGPRLLKEVRTVLGRRYQHEAEDVVQNLYLCLLEKMFPAVPARGDAIQWLCVVIGERARERMREMERDRGNWEDDEG